MANRKIIHIDMDAFYASVEQRDFPQFRGKPVIVGGAPDKRGVVAACSYEARVYGIHSAMPSSRAIRLCPDAICLKPRFDEYRKVSLEIRNIFKSFTERIEPLSLDEAYLDVTDSKYYNGSATNIARAIKRKIKAETGLTASAGVSYNKFLAKVASDMDKPDGLFVITPSAGVAFVEKLPIRKFYGIGGATEEKMKSLNIYTGADLKQYSREALVLHFGKTGNYYYDIARGIDERLVTSHQVRKSLGSETTFNEDLSDITLMVDKLEELAIQVIDYLAKKDLYARTITVKVKYADFHQVTRSMTLDEPFNDPDTVMPLLPNLLGRTEAGKKKVRLLGVTASNLTDQKNTREFEQMPLV